MTPSLRKIHRYTWFSLAILLPLSWLIAIRAIPEGVWQTPVHTGQPDPLPVLMQSRESGDFIFNLRQDPATSRRQIEIFIKKPPTHPNTTVILETSEPIEGKKEHVLGLLGSRGVWRFHLDSLASSNQHFSLRLEDHIQHRILRTIPFEASR